MFNPILYIYIFSLYEDSISLEMDQCGTVQNENLGIYVIHKFILLIESIFITNKY